MKKVYSTPVATAEEFEANEYVAACWGVGCDVDAANQYSASIGLNVTVVNGTYVAHSADHCGLSTNQAVKTNASGVATGMEECGTDGLGTLTCAVYSDPNYSSPLSYSAITPGMKIYWTTKSGSKTWYHQGTVQETYAGHPNRS